MAKKERKLEQYREELLSYDKNANLELMEAIFNYLGLSIFNADAELVSTTDSKELDTVKNSFLRKKLGLTNFTEEEFDLKIKAVGNIFGSSNKRKFRVLFYYFLTRKFDKEEVFLGKRQIQNKEITSETTGNLLDNLDEERKANIEKIKNSLNEKFGDRIISAVAYGSVFTEEFNELSDYDILIAVKKTDIRFLKELKKIRNKFLEENIKIDFKAYSQDDIPEVRKELFWHNNRGLYVQKEFNLYGAILIGKNLFTIGEIDKKEMLREAVRVINSLNYNARKIIVNEDLNKIENKIKMMNWGICATMYALASKGIFPKTKREALQTFYDSFEPPIDPEKFLNIKVNRISHINPEDIEVAYEFLTYLNTKIFEDYTNFKN